MRFLQNGAFAAQKGGRKNVRPIAVVISDKSIDVEDIAHEADLVSTLCCDADVNMTSQEKFKA